MLEDPRLAPLLKLPPSHPQSEEAEREIRNIWESPGWHRHVERGQGHDGVDTSFGTENDRRNIVVQLNLDGFNPWRRLQHTMTPMSCMILNLPDNLRHLDGFMILAGLMPGPRAPTDQDPYLNVLVDELLELWNHGIDLDDGTHIRVKLLCSCADYPAHEKNNNMHGAPAKFGCHFCHAEVCLLTHCVLHARMICMLMINTVISVCIFAVHRRLRQKSQI